MVLVRGWAPFVLLLVAYEAMRDVASVVGMPAHDLARFDRALFDGYQPTLVLQAAVGKLADADPWRQSRKVGIVLWLWAVIVWVVVVYLGEHYVTDVIGGVAYATIAIVIVRALSARLGAAATRQSPA